MICTEAKAMGMWCPMVRCLGAEIQGLGIEGVAGVNCDHDKRTPKFSFCVGLDCMMWEKVGDRVNSGYCGLSNKR